MLKGAIFDMDGTLTDTERLYHETWVELEKDFGIQGNPEFPDAVCGSNGERMLEIIRSYYPDADAVGYRAACYATVARKTEEHVPLKEGAEEILAYLKENACKLAIASSSSREQIISNLTKTNLLSYFDEIVGIDDVTSAKPDPEIYQLTAARLGLDPSECYIFEDGFNGLRSGLAAGGKVAMVVDMCQPDDEIAPRCAAIFQNLSEALDAIKDGRF